MRFLAIRFSPFLISFLFLFVVFYLYRKAPK
ncbi:hypothetical protein, partial [Hydrotalea sp.]